MKIRPAITVLLQKEIFQCSSTGLTFEEALKWDGYQNYVFMLL